MQQAQKLITFNSNCNCYYKKRCRHQRCGVVDCCCCFYWHYHYAIVFEYIRYCCCDIFSTFSLSSSITSFSSTRYMLRILSTVTQLTFILMMTSTTKYTNVVECTILNAPFLNVSNSTTTTTTTTIATTSGVILDQIQRKEMLISSVNHTVTQTQQQKLQQRDLHEEEHNHLQRMNIQQQQQQQQQQKQSTLPFPNTNSFLTNIENSINNYDKNSDNNNENTNTTNNNLIAIIHIGPMKTGSSAIQKGYMYTKNALLQYDNYSDISWAFTGTNIQTWNYIGCYRTDINTTTTNTNTQQQQQQQQEQNDKTNHKTTIRRKSRQLQQQQQRPTLSHNTDCVPKNDDVFHNDDEDDYDYEDDYYFNRNGDSDDLNYDDQFVQQQYSSQTHSESNHNSNRFNTTTISSSTITRQQKQKQLHRKLVELKCNKDSIQLMTLLSTKQQKHLIISAEYLTYPYINIQQFSIHIKKYWSKQQKIIAYYRRYYEWLLSLHNQISKYKLPPSRKTFLYIVQKEIKRKFKWHRDYIISAIHRFQHYFTNNSIHIYNLHDTIQIPNGDVRYHFFCHALINATHACTEFIKQRSMYETTTTNDTTIGSSKLHSSSSSAALRNFENPSVPLVYSELVYYAIELGYVSLNGQSIFDGVYNSNLIKLSQKFHKERTRQNSIITNNNNNNNNNVIIDNDDMKDYRICPNNTEYDWLLQQSLQVEEQLLPIYYKQYGKIEISIDYNYIKTHYIFCHYNTKEFLQNNNIWKQFYLSINKNKK